MKANKFIKDCGPYEVHSISQAPGGVRLLICPAFPKYGQGWAMSREKGDGGGPSIFTAIALAKELEAFLNQPYTPEQVAEWKATLDRALRQEWPIISKGG